VAVAIPLSTVVTTGYYSPDIGLVTGTGLALGKVGELFSDNNPHP